MEAPHLDAKAADGAPLPAPARETPAEAPPPSPPLGAAEAPVARDRRPQRVLVALTVAALASALCASGVALWGLHQWGKLAREALPAEREGQLEVVQQAAHPATEPTPAASGAPATPPTMGPPVPQETKVEIVGAVAVVDIGIGESHLASALAKQQEEAKDKRQILVVMLSGRSCAPCRGIESTLEEPNMQQALAGVRLVRVDLDVFREELVELRIPHDLYPAFFLLDRHLRPLDAIHGGEWDADVPANIAPVLGAFVRGQYQKRRHHWAPVARSVEL